MVLPTFDFRLSRLDRTIFEPLFAGFEEAGELIHYKTTLFLPCSKMYILRTIF